MRAFKMAMAVAALVLPAAAWAQSADLNYCKALSSSYREYSKGTVNAEAAAAMAQCDSNAVAAIPVLEKHLKEGKQALPARN